MEYKYLLIFLSLLINISYEDPININVTPLTLTIHFVLFLVSSFNLLPIPAANIIACIFFMIVLYPIVRRFSIPGENRQRVRADRKTNALQAERD